MANQKNWYYILVLTNTGPVFVTGIPGYHQAKWDRLEKPMSFPKTRAEDITLGLNANCYTSYVVCSKWELDYQPYLYSHGEFKWVEKEREDEEDA